MIGPFLGLENRLKLFSQWPKFANWFLHLSCGIKVEVIGQENLPTEPCVIVSNHQGQWKPIRCNTSFIPCVPY